MQGKETIRDIVHIDMDAFFASVEQRDNPELRGKPLAVGFDGDRGVVSTASYEARRYGVHSAMSMQMAKRRCPELIVVPADHARYKAVSMQVHQIFGRYTDVIEPLSIDEAFLDLTGHCNDMSAFRIAEKIRATIKTELNLTASAGVSYNKFLAKIASDYNKPDGIFEVSYDTASDFIASLPIKKFWGVGPKTASVMYKMGIFNGLQLRQCPLEHLKEVFGKAGQIYYDFARGIDLRMVESLRERKSVGCEQTFLKDLTRKSAVTIELYHIVMELERRISKVGFDGCTLTLKIKFGDFVQQTRSVTMPKSIKKKKDILPLAKRLLSQINCSMRPIRLIGLSVSNAIGTERHGNWVEGMLDFKDK